MDDTLALRVDEPAPEPAADEERPSRAAGPRRPLISRRFAILLSLAPASVIELLPQSPGALQTLAGLWLLFGAPVLLWRGITARIVTTGTAALLLSVGFTVMTDIVVALTVNTALPPLGVERPLTRLILTVATAGAVLVLGVLAPEPPRSETPLWQTLLAARGLRPVAAVGALALVLAVAGPIRLNNGLGGAVSTVALVVVAALICLLLLRRARYPVEVLEFGLYCASAALLLITSLRGQFITGHDIQKEFLYFRLALGGEYWDISTYTDPYNACLSITLLPVSVFQLTALSDTAIFKVVLPLLFAFTPVLVHRAVRNVAPRVVALISAMYFIIFPTFLTDMPYLGRQEIAFLLLGCAMVVLTDSDGSLPLRRIVFVVLLGGIVLSHYSTTYVVVGTLAVSYLLDKVWRLVSRRGRERARRKRREDRMLSFLTWWVVLVPAALALLWSGPLTHTGGQLERTLSSVASAVLGGESESGSSDTAYSILGGEKVPATERLKEYKADLLKQTAAERGEGGDYLPLKEVNGLSTPVVEVPTMKLTLVGRVLDAVGISVPGLNGGLRQAAALFFQVMAMAGFVVALWARRSAFRPVRDQVTIAAGAWFMVAVFTLVPQLSVDYSLLRAFQQGLFFFAPFLATATLWALRWARHRTVPLACVLLAGLLLDLSGVVPKVLGGYPAQVQLSNSGQYYSIYYPHAEERRAALWLDARVGKEGTGLVQTDRFSYSRLQALLTHPTLADIHPAALRSDSYVLLGTTPTRTGRVTVFYGGDLITYQYPMKVLDSRDLIYSNGGAVIYR
ncbi:DUF2206 domain-containing protein [Streptomyces fulvoviolaceus]|uniref:DUF2206 domain-containing protein n=1 Tax=Streptomyces fulvoviolaceus TaxID=285535 RepID=UPI0021C15FE8|nr:DUF2206 domain-containing protein [Streptomyces fulvoviolaceus]MCT9082294.1 DUF2206 domain-containing protein [Streptomyces fulvoviolaceus]